MGKQKEHKMKWQGKEEKIIFPPNLEMIAFCSLGKIYKEYVERNHFLC